MPSPRFCTECSRSMKGDMPTQTAPSAPIEHTPLHWPTLSGSMSATIPWQPIPTPTSVSSGTRVLELCGQPEQKYGVRRAEISRGRLRRVTTGGDPSRSLLRCVDSRECNGPTSASASNPSWRRSRGRPPVVLLAHHDGPFGERVEGVLDKELQIRILLLQHDDLGQAVGEAAHERRVNGVGERHLRQTGSRRRLCRRVSTGPAAAAPPASRGSSCLRRRCPHVPDRGV